MGNQLNGKIVSSNSVDDSDLRKIKTNSDYQRATTKDLSTFVEATGVERTERVQIDEHQLRKMVETLTKMSGQLLFESGCNNDVSGTENVDNSTRRTDHEADDQVDNMNVSRREEEVVVAVDEKRNSCHSLNPVVDEFKSKAINGSLKDEDEHSSDGSSVGHQTGESDPDVRQEVEVEVEEVKPDLVEEPCLRNREHSGKSAGSSCENESQHSGTFSDLHSEGSSDSGKGSSDIQGSTNDANTNTVCEIEEPESLENQVIIYQFELPQELCGRLIGKSGHFVNLIKEETQASVIVNRHPYAAHIKICSIQATRSQVRQALRLIRSRFPAYEYPEVTLQQINVINPIATPMPVPQSCQLSLPDGVSCDVILSSTVSAGHIFLQQPTHPTYPSLSRLDLFMNATYGPTETPCVPNPTPGIICAVPVCGGWYRALVVNVDDDECDVKFVDYGGFTRVQTASLRQIRLDFMTLPFQASECYLGNVVPTSDSGWTVEANTFFEELAQGQILQAFIVAYSKDGIPYVHLHKIQGASNVFINRELVERGFAKWIDTHAWSRKTNPIGC